MPTIPLLLAAIALLAPLASRADDDVLQRVLVEGARASALGGSDSANAGSVTQKQLEARIAYRPGELLEAVPGLVVSQHSGEGKANQFYLRGFNLDHGTDLRTTLDGMPVNQRSHAHGQGWTDLNFVIPELTARLDYRKGPYAAQDGDFASAGSAAITYANRLTHGVASVGAGQDGYARIALANSLADSPATDGSLLYAVEALHNDGPFVHPDDYRKLNAVLRFSHGYANNGFSLSAMAYRAQWNASDQVPLRALASGALGRYDALDASDGGQSHRYSLSGSWRRTGSDDAASVSAYVIGNRLELYSNFTYFLHDPVNGDQFGQPDRRVTSGIDAARSWHVHGLGQSIDFALGLQLQNDNIFNALLATRERVRLATVRQDHVVESSAGLFGEAHVRWSETLRSVAGLRMDQYRFDVRSDLPANSGQTSAHLASPSLSMVFGPWANVEYYLNLGEGFHSNDARGTTITADPRTGQARGAVPGLVRSHAVEAGVRGEWGGKLQGALSLYRLDFDSELTFVGDAGTTQAGPASRRYGIEISNAYKALQWLSFDGDLAFARARASEFDLAGSRIPGAVEGVAQFGLTVGQRGPWSGALHLRYFGPRPLVADNSVRSHASAALNGRLAYKLAKDLQLSLEGFNLCNRGDSAVDYFYASRLRGESSAVEDIHLHPSAPRSLRLTLSKNF
jgi:hypothetical protein